MATLRGMPTSLVAQTVKNPPAVQETRVWSRGGEDSLEKRMAPHSSILALRIPWTEEPGGLQSMGSQRVEHDRKTDTHTHMQHAERYFPDQGSNPCPLCCAHRVLTTGPPGKSSSYYSLYFKCNIVFFFHPNILRKTQFAFPSKTNQTLTQVLTIFRKPLSYFPWETGLTLSMA